MVLWGKIFLLSEFLGQEVDVLMGEPFGEPGELADLVQVGNTLFPKEFCPVIIFEVAVDGLFAVVGFHSDLGVR